MAAYPDLDESQDHASLQNLKWSKHVDCLFLIQHPVLKIKRKLLPSL